ncbi:MAG TPA: undecaprenyl-diphosphate phosphatase [bacterium]|nr:undecaprenyl-diphosphate phosphatase [bacterium]HEX67494.1 undecaprenyl-diphosphate phosphatase [bacterium]
MTIKESILFGVLQGLTEFLPISSSGHLLLISKFLNRETLSPLFIIFLHGGTLLSILIYFLHDIKRLLLSLFHLKDKSLHNLRRLFSFVIVGSLPIAIVGALGEKLFLPTFQEFSLLPIFFLITATLLYFSDKYPKRKVRHLSYANSFLIGTAQILSLFPGISRSGITVATGLFLGVKRKECFRFSFFLAIPAILGAMVKEIVVADVYIGKEEIVGFLTAMIVGFFSLFLFHKILAKRRLYYFSFYLYGIAFLSIIIALTR